MLRYALSMNLVITWLLEPVPTWNILYPAGNAAGLRSTGLVRDHPPTTHATLTYTRRILNTHTHALPPRLVSPYSQRQDVARTNRRFRRLPRSEREIPPSRIQFPSSQALLRPHWALKVYPAVILCRLDIMTPRMRLPPFQVKWVDAEFSLHSARLQSLLKCARSLKMPPWKTAPQATPPQYSLVTPSYPAEQLRRRERSHALKSPSKSSIKSYCTPAIMIPSFKR